MNKKMKNAQLALVIEGDSRWASVISRNSNADGRFYYSVKTTGIYCRPSCAARKARPENISFHMTPEDAEKAGFRPCKRCKPNQPSLVEQYAAMTTKACRLIEESETTPSLVRLANHVGISMFHFHRIFKTVTGLTPREYALAQLGKRIRNNLDNSETVTEAIYNTGYRLNGRFYEVSNEVLGMTPSNYRAGAAGSEIHFAVGQCSLGSILVAKSDRGICAILLGDEPDELIRDLQNRFPHANIIGGDLEFEQLVSKVVGFVEKPATGLDLPLDIRGTAFQQRVWRALRKIPPGCTTSYTEIANRIGYPTRVRSVARACAANSIAVAIPCHRVVKKDGSLSGYRWGVERKRALLKREAQAHE